MKTQVLGAVMTIDLVHDIIVRLQYHYIKKRQKQKRLITQYKRYQLQRKVNYLSQNQIVYHQDKQQNNNISTNSQRLRNLQMKNIFCHNSHQQK
ncbi:unnamed protein product [Paramecium octaurelia]|uniref:Uncharacterized protein n=1 Tax=Paramecium octaurelia TaxID=43137 RepID=A0A8S1TCL7_PAROT|nr:unnamed protein product [Paramecium octaurelia]